MTEFCAPFLPSTECVWLTCTQSVTPVIIPLRSLNRESFMQIKAIKVLQLWVMWNSLKKINQWDFYCPKMAPATIKKLVIIDNMCSLLLSMTYNGWCAQTTSLSWALACRIIFIWNLCVSKVRGHQHIQNKTSPLSNLYPQPFIYDSTWISSTVFLGDLAKFQTYSPEEGQNAERHPQPRRTSMHLRQADGVQVCSLTLKQWCQRRPQAP